MNLAGRLLEAKALTAAQLAPALRRQKQYRGFLAKHLTELGIMKPGELAPFLQSCPLPAQSFEDLGLPEQMLAPLFLKHALYSYHFTLRDIAESLKIPMQLLELLLDYLKQQKFVDISPRDVLTPSPGHLAVDTRYTLSTAGKEAAKEALELSGYIGPAPVNMEDYWDWVEAQTILGAEVREARLREVFQDYVISEGFFDDLGPAVASGRSLFVYGPSGNGKTMAARTVAEVFDDPVYIPYALYVHGQIIRVFDKAIHQPVAAVPDGRPACDPRWILCRRPVITAGGEMTEAALEPKYDPVGKHYEAPHQMQANNGILIIDDFGRQRISPQALLNRWMFPLEGRQDFCNLHTGQQFAIPFDQLVIFCTNLNPGNLADEAFFRRIRHKIFLGDVTAPQYLEIFRRVCEQYGVAFDEPVVKQIMTRYYDEGGHPLRACHPRDLVEKVLDRAKFWRRAPELTFKELDLACSTYFVKNIGYVDYDEVKRESQTADVEI
ncbi:MAG: ATPase [Desulfobaccales bacterium]